ncbi:MAG: DUF1631 family protein, partial [Pseudomonadales bacterium]|nr:DUF1631 family protein [Pseudomonadales bacterium]
VISAIDTQSSDIINLVSLLYDAVWKDESVPIPIKELIGRTQVTILKVALSDPSFFNRENHPARRILNEFAEAGIGWTEVDQVTDDPMYQKIKELVNRLITEYDGDVAFFEGLVKDFRQFRAREAVKTRRLEQRILKAKERQERLEDIKELVTQKIADRFLGQSMPDLVKEILDGPFHKFMVMLVVKEGPGSNAWKQALNTIDVLLWSVQPKEHEGDRDRLDTVNPRLLNNLRKAFRIAQVESIRIESLIAELKAIQEETLTSIEALLAEKAAQKAAEALEAEQTAAQEAGQDSAEIDATGAVVDPSALSEHEPTPQDDSTAAPSADAELDPDLLQHALISDDGIMLADADETASATSDEPDEDESEPAPDNMTPLEFTVATEEDDSDTAVEDATGETSEAADDAYYLTQVDHISVGMWVEFQADDDLSIRCKLAAKINAIDKFIFVNRQGIKVVEKTRAGLAEEFRDGTVKLISDGLLFSRALETVIGNLRQSQIEQQTGSAYRPNAESA